MWLAPSNIPFPLRKQCTLKCLGNTLQNPHQPLESQPHWHSHQRQEHGEQDGGHRGEGDDVVVIAGNLASTDTLDGGAGNDTIDAGAGANQISIGSGFDSVLGGSGNDLVKVDVAELTNVDIIKFGAGVADTLELTTAGTVTDAQFRQITGLDAITLANGGNTVTLDVLALAALGAAGVSFFSVSFLSELSGRRNIRPSL